MLKIFLDTEFTGLQQDTSFISVALVAETGEEFYAEFTDYNSKQVSDWVLQNVISNCFLTNDNQSFELKKMHIKDDSKAIKSAIKIWLNQFGQKEESIQIWADVPHYDWVLFCELFGGARNIPKQIHFMPMDLATFLYAKGIKNEIARIELIKKENLPEGKQHNALFDAKLGLMIQIILKL